MAAARIKLGLQDKLELGNLDSYRDWGYAPDFCEAIIKIMESEEPDDYVVATGETHSVREFCQKTFEYADLNMDDCVVVNKKYFRAQEVPYLLGNPQKIYEKLGWRSKTSFDQLVKKMYDNDYSLARQEVAANKEKWEVLKELENKKGEQK